MSVEQSKIFTGIGIDVDVQKRLNREKGRAQALAEQLGTAIPNKMPSQMWCLPLLEELTVRIQELEKEVQQLKTAPSVTMTRQGSRVMFEIDATNTLNPGDVITVHNIKVKF